MHINIPLLTKTGICSVLVASPALVFAGPSAPVYMNYAINQTQAVPSLSGSMLILLSLLLFVVALKISKQKNKAGAKLFVSLLGVTALSVGAGGFKLVSDVKAGLDPQIIPALIVNNPDGQSGRVMIDQNNISYFINQDYPSGIRIIGFDTGTSGLVCGQDAVNLELNNNNNDLARPDDVTVEDYEGPKKTCGAIVPVRSVNTQRSPDALIGEVLDGNILHLNEACAVICIDPSSNGANAD